MIVVVEFLGTLSTLSGCQKQIFEFDDKATIYTLTHRLKAELFLGKDSFEDINILILVNGREISVLDGHETALKNKDTISLIPVSHGG